MRNGIRFYLGLELISLETFDPQLTVLEWLRKQAFRPGTKEGCAEGDCGACTVLVGRLKADKLRYQAVNACIQPLATLDGCHIITVEDVARVNGSLHPVQQAMVDNHGSQCGFCTPGFVMSLLALYHDRAALDDWSDEDILAGNLCRCTGYGPILAAAKAIAKGQDANPHPFDPDMAAKLIGLRDDATFIVEQGRRKFISPTTLSELLKLRHAHPDATIIAGSTDTGLWITKQHRDLGVQLWLGRVEALQIIEERDTEFEIGAGVSYNDSLNMIARHYPQAHELWRRIASVQIRNAGTVGGNIANGSPIGDTPPFLIAVGAKLRLRSQSGERELPLEDFFVAYGEQDIQPGEIVQSILVPKPKPNWELRIYKISKRFDQDISALCAAFYICLEDEEVTGARIAFGGMAATPKRAGHTEQCLTGKSWTRDQVEIATGAIARDFEPISDMRASAAYRLNVARNLLIKCYIETTSGQDVRIAGKLADVA